MKNNYYLLYKFGIFLGLTLTNNFYNLLKFTTMKQLRFISILVILFTGFNLAEISAQNWRLSLTTDFEAPLNDRYTDYWTTWPGYNGEFLVSRKNQKSSFTLLADYHFFAQKPVGFYVGTGIGHKNLETSIETVAPDLNAHIFSLSNIAVPLNIGLDIRPTNRLTINFSTTFEQMFATNNSGKEARYSGEQLNDERYVFGDFPDNVSSVYLSIKNKSATLVGLNMGFDIDVYKNYRLLIGTGIGYAHHRFDIVQGVYYFHPITGEADISGFTSVSNKRTTRDKQRKNDQETQKMTLHFDTMYEPVRY